MALQYIMTSNKVWYIIHRYNVTLIYHPKIPWDYSLIQGLSKIWIQGTKMSQELDALQDLTCEKINKSKPITNQIIKQKLILTRKDDKSTITTRDFNSQTLISKQEKN